MKFGGRCTELRPRDAVVCTAWGNFHKWCKVIEKSVGASAAATEVIDVLAADDQAFGFGERHTVFEAVNAAAATSAQSARGPAGGRAVYLGSLPQRFLDNYRSTVLTMRAHIEWKCAGHGRMHLETMHGLGRRTSALDLSLFAIVFGPMLERVVKPFGLAVQSVSLEPWVVHRIEQDMFGLLDLTLSAFCLRGVLTEVVSLARQQLAVSDVHAFVLAWSSHREMKLHFAYQIKHVVNLACGGDALTGDGAGFPGRAMEPSNPHRTLMKRCVSGLIVSARADVLVLRVMELWSPSLGIVEEHDLNSW